MVRRLRQYIEGMSSRRLFLAFVVLLLISLTALWSKWNGSAGINAGFPMDQWAVSFSGSVHGWPAFIGIVALLLAVIFLVWALIRTLME